MKGTAVDLIKHGVSGRKCACAVRGREGEGLGPRQGVLGSQISLCWEAGEFASMEERVVLTASFFLFGFFPRGGMLVLILLEGNCPPPTVATLPPTNPRHRPPDPSLHCPILPHFIALLNADNW